MLRTVDITTCFALVFWSLPLFFNTLSLFRGGLFVRRVLLVGCFACCRARGPLLYGAKVQ